MDGLQMYPEFEYVLLKYIKIQFPKHPLLF